MSHINESYQWVIAMSHEIKSNIPTIGPVVIPKLVNFSLSSLFDSFVTSSVSSNFNLDLRVGIFLYKKRGIFINGKRRVLKWTSSNFKVSPEAVKSYILNNAQHAIGPNSDLEGINKWQILSVTQFFNDTHCEKSLNITFFNIFNIWRF